MSQTTFSDIEYGNRKRTTNREEFLDIMEENNPMGRMGEICASILLRRQARQTYQRNRKNAENVSASGMVQPF